MSGGLVQYSSSSSSAAATHRENMGVGSWPITLPHRRAPALPHCRCCSQEDGSMGFDVSALPGLLRHTTKLVVVK